MMVLISPSGYAHIPGSCTHEGARDEGTTWAVLDRPRAWQRIGNGEQLQATVGARPGLIARKRCKSCEANSR